MRIQYFISRVIFYISLVILLTFLSLMVTTFCTLISVLFVGSCSNALDCVDLMSRRAVTCVSNKRRRTFIDGALRLLQLILSYTRLIGNILSFSSIQDGLFRGCLWMGGGTKSPLPKIWHISYNDETWHIYTLPKEDPKTIRITWHTPWVLLTSAFFKWKSANFVISRNTDIDSI